MVKHIMPHWIGFVVLLLLQEVAIPHEVKWELSFQQATVIQLRYGNGQPFAFEAYELYPLGKELPEQVGRTNAQGQLIFIPGSQTDWRLKAYSEDGHGIDHLLTVANESSPIVLATISPLSRPLSLLVGLSILFGLFGLVQLLFARKQTNK